MGRISQHNTSKELKLGFGIKTVIYPRLRNKKTTPSSPLLLFYGTGCRAVHFTPLGFPEVRGWGLGGRGDPESNTCILTGLLALIH